MRDTVEAEIYASLVMGRAEKQKRESADADAPVASQPQVNDIENIVPNHDSAAHDSSSSVYQRCPMCNVMFPPTMENTEINAHVDNCLVE